MFEKLKKNLNSYTYSKLINYNFLNILKKLFFSIKIILIFKICSKNLMVENLHFFIS